MYHTACTQEDALTQRHSTQIGCPDPTRNQPPGETVSRETVPRRAVSTSYHASATVSIGFLPPPVDPPHEADPSQGVLLAAMGVQQDPEGRGGRVSDPLQHGVRAPVPVSHVSPPFLSVSYHASATVSTPP